MANDEKLEENLQMSKIIRNFVADLTQYRPNVHPKHIRLKSGAQAAVVGAILGVTRIMSIENLIDFCTSLSRLIIEIY